MTIAVMAVLGVIAGFVLDGLIARLARERLPFASVMTDPSPPALEQPEETPDPVAAAPAPLEGLSNEGQAILDHLKAWVLAMWAGREAS